MEGIRSFIAIEIPQPFQVAIGDLQNTLRRTEAEVKWVRPEGIHLTLKFLGSIREEDLERISQAISPLVREWEPFELRIRGLGCFPSSRNPRVIWIGIDQGGKEVSALERVVEDTMALLNFAPESRTFTPHLTLGRVRSSKERSSLIRAMESRKDSEVGTFRAKEVHLFRSELRPSGAVHTKLRTYPMKGNE